MSDTNAVADVLVEHPRLMGALFAVCLLLSKASTAIAGNGSTTT